MSTDSHRNRPHSGTTEMTARDPEMAARGSLFLTCPRCRLSIRPRGPWLAIEHCPRCLARARIAVELFASTLPAEEPYDKGPAPRSRQ